MKKNKHSLPFYIILFLYVFSSLSCTRILFRETLVHGNMEKPILIRGSQPDAKAVNDLVAKYGIRTIINLRGESDKEWYKEEKNAADKHNVKIVNIPMNSQKNLQPDQVKVFFDTITNKNNWPVFAHCHGGSHRTGAMMAIYRKQFLNWNNEDALSELKDYSFNVGWHRRQKILHDIIHFQPIESYSLPKETLAKEGNLLHNNAIKEIKAIYSEHSGNHRNIPLLDKAKFFESDIQKYHLHPQGFLVPKIELSTNSIKYLSSKEDSFYYTSLYLACLCLRFATTQDYKVLNSIESLLTTLSNLQKPEMFFESMNTKHFSYIMFSYGIAYKTLQGLQSKHIVNIRKNVIVIMDYLQKRNFTLLEKHDTFSIQEKLAILRIAATIIQNNKILQTYRKFAIENNYLLKKPLPFTTSPLTNTMSLISLYHLIQMESGIYEYFPKWLIFNLPKQNINLKEKYQKNLKDIMYTVDKKNPLFCFMYYSCNYYGFSRKKTLKEAQTTLFEVPIDRFIYEKNILTTQKKYTTPIDERPSSAFYWEENFTNSVNLLSAKTTQKYCGVDFLLAYWLGRYHGFIEAE